ncbi:hypothetical protein RAS12_08435 [Achromobacter seleniivolatilans]|uniref:Uncharacterized protein n=1 Tax=Achromobacter seleniivolatilans TaxID=3047478 RepID=A0ABY9M5X9_9BURK|nr:hypothetical protein [Achromobacter sp. R39]WMD22391.1 hypothetical protein RAS12_08435 [Achromobacter sp. R39]
MPSLIQTVAVRRFAACAHIALVLTLLMPLAAQAQTTAPAPAPGYGKVSESLGDFQLVGNQGSRLRQIQYRGRAYRPLNAYEFISVKPLGPMIGGQPVLLAVSNDFMGVGTILIAVQNDTPLARVLSPTVDVRDPDMGLAQPGRQDVLLFTAGSRALVTSTAQVLWFEHLRPKEYLQSVPGLVSVSPDNGSGALLLDNEIRLSAAGQGPYASVPFTRALQSKAFKAAWDESSAIAKKALDEGKRIDQRRLYDNLKAEWINRNFRWQQSKDGWQLIGQGLLSAPIKQER